MSAVSWIILVVFFCLYLLEKILGKGNIFLDLTIVLAISACIYQEWLVLMIVAIAIEAILTTIIAYVKKKFVLAALAATLGVFVIKAAVSIAVYFLIQHLR